MCSLSIIYTDKLLLIQSKEMTLPSEKSSNQNGRMNSLLAMWPACKLARNLKKLKTRKEKKPDPPDRLCIEKRKGYLHECSKLAEAQEVSRTSCQATGPIEWLAERRKKSRRPKELGQLQ